MKSNFFETIQAKPLSKDIYKRLGYAQGITELGNDQKKVIDGIIDEAFGLLCPQGVYIRKNIVANDNGRTLLAGDLIVESRLFSALLQGCAECIFMGVCAGEEISQAIDKAQRDDLTKAVILDAVASEAVEACFEWIQQYLRQGLLREKKIMTSRRISCGYGDFDLQYQKAIVQILDMSRLGVNITDAGMLVPRKSATAVSGIKIVL